MSPTVFTSDDHRPGIRGALCFLEENVPAYEALPRFTADLDRLTPIQPRQLAGPLLEGPDSKEFGGRPLAALQPAPA